MIWLLVALNVAEIVGLGALLRQVLSATHEIHGELQPNRGSSSRDVLDRLERTSERLETASEQAALATASAQRATDTLTATISIATEIAVQNRTKLADLSGKVADAANAATVVADDLAASHDRADMVSGAPGAAADAASQSPRTS